MTPEISIILLTYNQETIIGRAIESILAQNCKAPYEIIIGEDASTDSTRAVCERYAAARPDIIRLMPPAPNKGIVRNYFDCLEAARGKYITDCAGDDFWTAPDKLTLEMETLREHPEATAAYSGYGIGSIPPEGSVSEGRPLLISQLGATSDPVLFLSAMMYRREDAMRLLAQNPDVICNPGFGCEDLPLICALLNAGDAVSTGIHEAVSYSAPPPILTTGRDPKGICLRMAAFIPMRLRLAKFYDVDLRHLHRYFRIELQRFAAAALMSGDPECRALFDRTAAAVPAGSITKKARLCRALMSVRPVWMIVRNILRLRYAPHRHSPDAHESRR